VLVTLLVTVKFQASTNTFDDEAWSYQCLYMERLYSLPECVKCQVHFSQSCCTPQQKRRKVDLVPRPARAKSENPEATTTQYITAGPGDSPPDYTEIDAQPLNKVITQLFRKKMVAQLGVDSTQQG